MDIFNAVVKEKDVCKGEIKDKDVCNVKVEEKFSSKLRGIMK